MIQSVDIHVGKRLRQRRLLMGLTQSQLAESAGVTFQQLQKYEMAKNRISASRLWAIAQTLEVTTEFFFRGLSQAEAEISQSGVVDVFDNAEVLELLKAYFSIPENRRQAVLDLAKGLGEASKELDIGH
ncbi:MAG: helix-turn-helix domain-containing protein [Paracoccaceae bacterium]